jgi:hypothetical protein
MLRARFISKGISDLVEVEATIDDNQMTSSSFDMRRPARCEKPVLFFDGK